MSCYKSILKKETGRDWSKKQDKLTIKRNNKVKASKDVSGKLMCVDCDEIFVES